VRCPDASVTDSERASIQEKTAHNAATMHVVDQTEALTKARQFADLAYSAEMNNAAKEFSTKRQAIQAQLAGRGVVLSGTMTNETARLSGEHVNKLVTKRLDLLLEGYAMHGVEMTEEIAAQTFDDVMKLRATMIGTATSTGARVGMSELPGSSGPFYAGLVEQHVTMTAASIRTEIDRRRFMGKKTEQTPQIVYHVYGNQPRWNTNSTDNSVNIVNVSTELVFANLRQQIAERVPAGEEQADILQRLAALEQEHDKASGWKRYSDFIASAANHMAIVAPFVPALTELLSRTIT